MKIASSTRLHYRLLDEHDSSLLYELDLDPEVMKYLTGGKPSTKSDICDTFIPRMQRYRNQAKGWGLWGVFKQSTNEFLGWVLIRPMGFFTDKPEYNNLEIGWRFKRQHWGEGYATEAANQIKHAVIKNDRVVTAISATALVANTGSIAVMKKIGLSYVHTYMHQGSEGEQAAVYYQLQL